MSVIDSLLRKKRLLLAGQRLALHESAKKLEQATQVFSVSRRANEEAQHYLLQQLSPDASLCVQRLAVAHGDVQRRDARMREAHVAYQSATREHHVAELAVAHTQREIDKLEEMREARLAEAARGRQVIEWQRLDEWVTVRQGERP